MAITGCAIEGAGSKKRGIIREADANVRIDPEVQTSFDQGVSELKDSNYKAAAELFEKVVKRARLHTAPFINLGLSYEGLGEYEKAEESFLKAIDLNPGHLVANTELGLLYRKMGKFDLARKAYETALETSPLYQPARKNLGILCDMYMGDVKCALSHFKKYLELSPDDEQVKIWVADLSNK